MSLVRSSSRCGCGYSSCPFNVRNELIETGRGRFEQIVPALSWKRGAVTARSAERADEAFPLCPAEWAV